MLLSSEFAVEEGGVPQKSANDVEWVAGLLTATASSTNLVVVQIFQARVRRFGGSIGVT